MLSWWICGGTPHLRYAEADAPGTLVYLIHPSFLLIGSSFRQISSFRTNTRRKYIQTQDWRHRGRQNSPRMCFFLHLSDSAGMLTLFCFSCRTRSELWLLLRWAEARIYASVWMTFLRFSDLEDVMMMMTTTTTIECVSFSRVLCPIHHLGSHVYTSVFDRNAVSSNII